MFDSFLTRLVLTLAVAGSAHLATVLLRKASARLLQSRLRSEAKALTITGFVTSVVVFCVYFAAFGFLLSEAGISLTTYLASASVIGLAVSFGSQGIVQDVITGLTVVFTDLIDVGDMVELGGQIGIVEKVGMRFTVLVNFFGAQVYVPNRSITNVTSYPKGYVRAFLDTRLPAETAQTDAAKARIWDAARAAYGQHPAVLLLPPSQDGEFETEDGSRYFRVKFRIWPGQGKVLEESVKQAVVRALKDLEEGYADWMVTVHYRAEPRSDDPSRRLPRPSALAPHAQSASANRDPLRKR